MQVLSIIILIFSLIAAADYLFGNKLGLGDEFFKGFKIFADIAIPMIGMIAISPLIANFLSPIFNAVYEIFKIDPSIISASLLANDMGGAPLSLEIAKNSAIGSYNAFVVSAMMGVTVCFTIPLAMSMVNKERQRELSLGLLSGIVTIPIGAFIAGLVCGLSPKQIMVDLLPLIILAVIIVLGLIFFPNVCVKIFKYLGAFMRALALVGFMMCIINSLFGKELIKGIAPIEEGAMVCVNTIIFMTGIFPLLNIISRLLSKTLVKISERNNMTYNGILGIILCLASNVPMFDLMKDMNKKDVVINSAFSVSAAFSLADHLAFTAAYNADYVLPMLVGKIAGGISAVLFALILYKKVLSKNEYA